MNTELQVPGEFKEMTELEQSILLKLSRRPKPKRQSPKEAELRQAIQHTIAILENADLVSGVCCCGDSMEGHSNPMACGHSPVDAGSYYTEQHVRYLRAVLSGDAAKYQT